MSDQPRAIETRFKGYRMRSRLEARWAVWLDYMALSFIYEREGYVLPDGTPYLPDFFVPEWDAFLEVKRGVRISEPSDMGLVSEANSRAEGLCASSGKRVIVVFGQPWPHEYQGVLFLPNGGDVESRDAAFVVCGRCGIVLLWSPADGDEMVSEALAVHTPHALCVHADVLPSAANNHLGRAFMAAREARFEHGESGAPR